MTADDYKDFDLPNSFIDETIQVCVVTRDLDKAVREYADRLGIGPWWVQDYAPPDLHGTTFRGAPADYSMRLALAWTGRMNWEIIQPLAGPSMYHEFLDQHGEGIQHVGLSLAGMGLDWEACYATFRERGCEPIQEGRWKGVRFCYFDTEGSAHTVFEVIDRPAGWQRPEPNHWYPAKA